MKAKVSHLGITKTGMILVTVALPDGQSGKILLRKEQLDTLHTYLGGIPKRGTEMDVEWFVAGSGEISSEWLEMAL